MCLDLFCVFVYASNQCSPCPNLRSQVFSLFKSLLILYQIYSYTTVWYLFCDATGNTGKSSKILDHEDIYIKNLGYTYGVSEISLSTICSCQWILYVGLNATFNINIIFTIYYWCFFGRRSFPLHSNFLLSRSHLWSWCWSRSFCYHVSSFSSGELIFTVLDLLIEQIRNWSTQFIRQCQINLKSSPTPCSEIQDLWDERWTDNSSHGDCGK